ncbi:MAG: DNA (cytosine-5-)-methyltransferase [Bacilli bacterium]
MPKYNIIELFSGIGSQLKALNNIGVETNVVSISEWDIHAFVAYDAIHNSIENLPEIEKMSKENILDKLRFFVLSNSGKEPMSFKTISSYSHEALKRIYSAIIRCNNIVDIHQMNGANINQEIDILTYSFPCQDLSNVGAFHGYNKGIDKNSGSRSSLLWEVGRILTEMNDLNKPLPRFLILENVPSLLSQRHKRNFDIWQNDIEKLGYKNKIYLLNASNYGIPQNRPRLIMISVFLPENEIQKNKLDQEINDYFESHNLENKEYIDSLNIQAKSLKSLLRTNYKNKTLYAEALECQPNDTISRKAIWKGNPKLIDEYGEMKYSMVRTLTTKQDRHPNSGNLYFDYEGNKRSKFRYLTPRECFLFMGFDETDFEKVIKNNPEFHKNNKLFPRDKLIRMAGNSIPVNLLEQVFKQVLEIDEMIKQNH